MLGHCKRIDAPFILDVVDNLKQIQVSQTGAYLVL